MLSQPPCAPQEIKSIQTRYRDELEAMDVDPYGLQFQACYQRNARDLEFSPLVSKSLTQRPSCLDVVEELPVACSFSGYASNRQPYR